MLFKSRACCWRADEMRASAIPRTARQNSDSDRPEQTAWWEQTVALFTGEPVFRNGTPVEADTPGDPYTRSALCRSCRVVRAIRWEARGHMSYRCAEPLLAAALPRCWVPGGRVGVQRSINGGPDTRSGPAEVRPGRERG